MFCQLFSLQNKSFLCLQHVENKGFQTVIKHRLKAIQKPIKNELRNREKNTENAHFVLKKCTFRFRDYTSNNYLLVLIFDIAVGYFCMYIAALLKFNVLKRKNQALENALTEKQQENVAILLEHQNEKQQALQQGELEWLTEKIKVFTEEEQEAILASALSFAEHDLIVAPSINIQPKETCSQQELMYFVCSAFYNMDKSRSKIVSFLMKIFPLYFPAGESVLAKRCRD